MYNGPPPRGPKPSPPSNPPPVPAVRVRVELTTPEEEAILREIFGEKLSGANAPFTTLSGDESWRD